jgi:hypothetical protein
MESCEICGFEWDAVPAGDVSARAVAAAAALGRLLRDHQEAAAVRRTSDRWSPLEYAGHVRDVLLNLRDRIILGAAEDNPVPKPMHGDARIALGLYRADTPETVAIELNVAAGLFTKTWEALTEEQRARPIFYGWPRSATRTLVWVAAQAVHEAEHHLGDVADDLAAAG